jgi:hypothetical protein
VPRYRTMSSVASSRRSSDAARKRCLIGCSRTGTAARGPPAEDRRAAGGRNELQTPARSRLTFFGLALITRTGITLSHDLISTCPAFARSRANSATVDCLLRAIDAALNGCPR